jgi:hypothetical protein
VTPLYPSTRKREWDMDISPILELETDMQEIPTRAMTFAVYVSQIDKILL